MLTWFMYDIRNNKLVKCIESQYPHDFYFLNKLTLLGVSVNL